MIKTISRCLQIIIYLFLSTNCSSENFEMIRAYADNGEVVELSVSSDIEELKIQATRIVFTSIEGLENLKKLKELTFVTMPKFSDYSFLENMETLERLFFIACEIDDFEFLKKMPKLEILFFDGGRFFSDEIDFINNKKLELFTARNMHFIQYKDEKEISKPFVLKMKNIPESLKYCNLSHSPYLYKTHEFINRLSTVPYIYISPNDHKRFGMDLLRVDKDEYEKMLKNQLEIIKYPNVYTNKDTLPKEYDEDTLLSQLSDVGIFR